MYPSVMNMLSCCGNSNMQKDSYMIPEKVLAAFGPDNVMDLTTISRRTGLEKRSVAVAVGKLVKAERLWRHGYDRYSLSDRPPAIFAAHDAILRVVRENGTTRSFTTKFMRDKTCLGPEECLKAIHELVERKQLSQVKRGVYTTWN